MYKRETSNGDKRKQNKKTFQKPFVSEQNRLPLLPFASRHITWSIDERLRVVSSDQSPFCLQDQSADFVWWTDDEKHQSRSMQGTVKHQNSINVWRVFLLECCRRFTSGERNTNWSRLLSYFNSSSSSICRSIVPRWFSLSAWWRLQTVTVC